MDQLLGLVVACLVAATVSEPPVPQGLYGTPGKLDGQGGYPSGGSNDVFSGYGGDNSDGESANEFKYDVDAPEYNVKFGHQEARQGDVAQGKYYVLLPDGRTQMVEYIADQDGYRPTITYEDPQGGYRSGGPGQRGYPSEGPVGVLSDQRTATGGQTGYKR